MLTSHSSKFDQYELPGTKVHSICFLLKVSNDTTITVVLILMQRYYIHVYMFSQCHMIIDDAQLEVRRVKYNFCISPTELGISQ